MGQQRQCELALAPFLGEVSARYGGGGASSLLAWQLPALPTALFDPAGRAKICSLDVHLIDRNHEKTATSLVRKEPVYIFGRVDENIQVTLFILANILQIVRNFHERVIFNFCSCPSASGESAKSGRPSQDLVRSAWLGNYSKLSKKLSFKSQHFKENNPQYLWLQGVHVLLSDI